MSTKLIFVVGCFILLKMGTCFPPAEYEVSPEHLETDNLMSEVIEARDSFRALKCEVDSIQASKKCKDPKIIYKTKIKKVRDTVIIRKPLIDWNKIFKPSKSNKTSNKPLTELREKEV